MRILGKRLDTMARPNAPWGSGEKVLMHVGHLKEGVAWLLAGNLYGVLSNGLSLKRDRCRVERLSQVPARPKFSRHKSSRVLIIMGLVSIIGLHSLYRSLARTVKGCSDRPYASFADRTRFFDAHTFLAAQQNAHEAFDGIGFGDRQHKGG